MNNELKQQIEAAIPEALKQAKGVVFANKLVKVSGIRSKLPLKGRDLDIVFYPAQEKNAPLIIGFHGGGFLFGGCALDDSMWCAVRDELKVNIVSVGYRQSPEYKWETCLEDAYDSAVYITSHPEEFDADPDNISLMGQSAGGNLAAAVVLKNNASHEMRIKYQVLLYPYLDLYNGPDEKGAGSFDGIICYVMNELHVDRRDAENPFVSPFYANDQMLVGSPETIIVYCENDNLKNEAISYAEKLKNAGADVHEMLAENMPHGYFESGFKQRISPLECSVMGSQAEQIIADGSLRNLSDKTLKFIKKEMKR